MEIDEVNDVPTQPKQFKESQPKEHKLNLTGVSSVVTIKKRSVSSNDEDTPKKPKLLYIEEADLPNDQEIGNSISSLYSCSKPVISEMLSDSEDELDLIEQKLDSFLIYKKKKANKDGKIDIWKNKIVLQALPTRVMTRAVNKIHKPIYLLSQESDIDPDIVYENILRVKTMHKRFQNDMSPKNNTKHRNEKLNGALKLINKRNPETRKQIDMLEEITIKSLRNRIVIINSLKGPREIDKSKKVKHVGVKLRSTKTRSSKNKAKLDNIQVRSYHRYNKAIKLNNPQQSVTKTTNSRKKNVTVQIMRITRSANRTKTTTKYQNNTNNFTIKSMRRSVRLRNNLLDTLKKIKLRPRKQDATKTKRDKRTIERHRRKISENQAKCKMKTTK